MLDFIIQKDQEFLIFLNNLGNSNWDGFWMFMTSKYTSVPLYLTLVAIFGKKYGFKKALVLVVVGVVLITASDQLANLFKFGFKRLRPCSEGGVQELIRIVSGCGGKFGYFSAHASTGMTLAVFFGLTFSTIYKKLIFVLLFMAFLIGYSRIYIGVHYPLDVVTGFFLGSIIGLLGFRLLQFVLQRFHDVLE